QWTCRFSWRVGVIRLSNEPQFNRAHRRGLVKLKIAFLCLRPSVQLVEVPAPQRLDCSIVCAIALFTLCLEADGAQLELISPNGTLHSTPICGLAARHMTDCPP